MAISKLCFKDRKILIRLGERSDADTVIKFLQKNFLPYVYMSQRGLLPQSKENKEYYVASLDSGTSVVALTDGSKKEIVGVNLASKFTENESKEKLKKLKELSIVRGYPSDIDGMIFAEEMKLRSQVCHRYNVNEVFSILATSVHRDFQHCSLASTMIRKSLDYATQLGFRVFIAMAATDGGVKLQKALDFHTIYTQKYIEYQDHRGIFVYNTFPPEATTKIVAKVLPQT